MQFKKDESDAKRIQHILLAVFIGNKCLDAYKKSLDE